MVIFVVTTERTTLACNKQPTRQGHCPAAPHPKTAPVRVCGRPSATDLQKSAQPCGGSHRGNRMDIREQNDIQSALQTGIFAPLPEDERKRLAAHARVLTFAQGATLFREGEAATDPMLLLTGMVKLCRHSTQGKECVLHIVRPGRLLDAGVLFYEETLPITAIAVQGGSVLRLERRALLETLGREPGLCMELLAAMSLRQRLFINKIAGSQGRISVPGRVAAWLLHRAKMEKSASLSMGVTQETLARQMGISRESLSRELSALAASGLIDRNRRHIILLNAEALRARADA